MFLLYSLPFYLISIILIIIIQNILGELGTTISGCIGLGLGVVSLLLGILIDALIDKTN